MCVHHSFVCISLGIYVVGVRILQNMPNQAFLVRLLPLVLLVELLVVVQQNLFVEQICIIKCLPLSCWVVKLWFSN